jgi:hypothetical protein
MPNLRIVTDNATERATIAALTTAASYPVANLTSDRKSKVHRSTAGTTQTYTLTWTAAEVVGCVAMPFCNLSPTATIRVRLYASDGTTVIYDSGVAWASQVASVKLRGWTAAQAASAYAYGGGSCTRLWFTPVNNVFKAVIDITDTANLQGYIESAFLVVGDYWSPTYNAAYGASVEITDSAEHVGMDSGDLITEQGTIGKILKFSLEDMPPADRKVLFAKLLSSKAYPVFLSIFPGSTDLELERDHTIYGKRTNSIAFSITHLNGYTMPLEIKQV